MCMCGRYEQNGWTMAGCVWMCMWCWLPHGVPCHLLLSSFFLFRTCTDGIFFFTTYYCLYLPWSNQVLVLKQTSGKGTWPLRQGKEKRKEKKEKEQEQEPIQSSLSSSFTEPSFSSFSSSQSFNLSTPSVVYQDISFSQLPRTMIFNLYIFNKHCECIYYKEWLRPNPVRTHMKSLSFPFWK